MWAKFINPEGDINSNTNYIQGTAGSLPFWGNSWRPEEDWESEGWRNDMPDDWRPPDAPVPMKAKLNALNADYSGRLFSLAYQLTKPKAALTGIRTPEQIAANEQSIIAKYQETVLELRTKQEAIKHE